MEPDSPIPPRRCGVAPSKQSLAGRPNGEPVRPGSGVFGDAGQPRGQPVGQPVLRRLSAAHDTLPGRIDVAGATPGIRGEGVQTRSPLCRTEPSARGVAPATADAARPATRGRAARPQDGTAQADARKAQCESPKGWTVNRPPASFSHSGAATGGSARTSANALRSVSPPDRGSGPWRRRPSSSTPSSRIRYRRSWTPPLPRKRRGVPGQDHLTDCTYGPRRPPPGVQPSRPRFNPVSVARSSAARMSSSPAGSPKPGVLPPLRGSSSCVTGGPATSDSAKRPPKRPEWPRERLSGRCGGGKPDV